VGLAASLLGVLLLTGCVTDGPAVQDRTRSQAAELARRDVRTVAEAWQAAVRAALEDGRSGSSAQAAGRRAAAGAPVPHLTLLDETAAGGRRTDEVALAVAVVQQVSGGGGSIATTETVRVCALLVAPRAPGGSPSVGNLECPASLPDTVPGLGTVSATVPYAE
jgi:hypothetical protein